MHCVGVGLLSSKHELQHAAKGEFITSLVMTYSRCSGFRRAPLFKTGRTHNHRVLLHVNRNVEVNQGQLEPTRVVRRWPQQNVVRFDVLVTDLQVMQGVHSFDKLTEQTVRRV